MAEEAHNVISGGVFFNTVIQGQNITVQLPPVVRSALSGLPAATAIFTGRDAELDNLLGLLDPHGPERERVQVSAVAGLAGIGKTELVLQAAHSALERGWFPGGVLFVDLYGYDPDRRLEPGQAMQGFLRGLGVPPEHIPSDPQDRSRLYNSVISAYSEENRPILIIIDNASSSAQAKPLLPPRGQAVALVTSRHTLGDLGARLLDLEALSLEDGATLLERYLSQARGTSDTRVSEHPNDARMIAELCGGLPLAVAIVAAVLAAHYSRSLHTMAADLHEARSRLDEMSYEDRAVRAAFDLSYRDLDGEQARVFRMLSLNPGPDVSTDAVASMILSDQRRARQVLDQLASAHLVEHANTEGRWRMHDLVRLYASELGQADADRDSRAEALTRLLNYYLSTTISAVFNTEPVAESYLAPILDEPSQGLAAVFSDPRQATEWLTSERLNLIAVCSVALATDHLKIAADLPHAMALFLERWRHVDDLTSIAQGALRASRMLQDRHREAAIMSFLGQALSSVGRFKESLIAFRDAVLICMDLGNAQGAAAVLVNTSHVLRQIGHVEEAVLASTEAANVFRECGDQNREAIALRTLSDVLADTKQFPQAIEACQRAVEICQQIGDRHREAQARNSLGTILSEVSRFEEAAASHEAALAIYREFEDRPLEAEALNGLGRAWRGMERFEDAIGANHEAATVFRKFGNRELEEEALRNLGKALGMAGRFTEAIAVNKEAAAVLRGEPNIKGTGHVQL